MAIVLRGILVTSKAKHVHPQARRRKSKKDQTEHLEIHREFLKSDRWEQWRKLQTDQKKGVPPPQSQKPYPEDAKLVSLVSPEEFTIGRMPLIEAIKRRRSRRVYTEENLTLEELSFLLWVTQGISKITRRDVSEEDSRALARSRAVLRTVPSGGARHPFETYLLVNRVKGVESGLYRYLPLENKLCLLRINPKLTDEVHEASSEQYVKNSAVTFIWTAIPYRTEWRYNFLSPKIIAQDSGHMCQNLYLACEAIRAGTTAIGAYDQKKMDNVLGVDGNEEFTIYVAPVGKIENKLPLVYGSQGPSLLASTFVSFLMGFLAIKVDLAEAILNALYKMLAGAAIAVLQPLSVLLCDMLATFQIFFRGVVDDLEIVFDFVTGGLALMKFFGWL